MKASLLPILLGFGTLLPAPAARAAEFGGFEPGQTFSFTVTDKSSNRTRGGRLTKNVPVPRGIPDFDEGQTVNFVIGARGQLTGPGFSIRFRRDEADVNFYSRNSRSSSFSGSAATVSKTRNDVPEEATLTFFRLRFSGFTPISHVVHYKLE
jgi:hypothetical protein